MWIFFSNEVWKLQSILFIWYFWYIRSNLVMSSLCYFQNTLLSFTVCTTTAHSVVVDHSMQATLGALPDLLRRRSALLPSILILLILIFSIFPSGFFFHFLKNFFQSLPQFGIEIICHPIAATIQFYVSGEGM